MAPSGNGEVALRTLELILCSRPVKELLEAVIAACPLPTLCRLSLVSMDWATAAEVRLRSYCESQRWTLPRRPRLQPGGGMLGARLPWRACFIARACRACLRAPGDFAVRKDGSAPCCYLCKACAKQPHVVARLQPCARTTRQWTRHVGEPSDSMCELRTHPLLSHLKETGDLPPVLVSRLREFAACMVREKLLTRCAHMNVLAPMGLQVPRVEAMLNTKLSFQFSRGRGHEHELARAAGSPISRTCAACSGQLAACMCGRASCDGVECTRAVGRRFRCGECATEYTLRWAYETGSGTSSIGRNPDQFSILPFTEDMEDLVCQWESRNADAPKYNNIVLVIYCGAGMCAHCALGLEHKNVQHGSILGFHQDQGGGANSQRAGTVNRTLSLGHPRWLTMQMRAHHGVKGCVPY